MCVSLSLSLKILPQKRELTSYFEYKHILYYILTTVLNKKKGLIHLFLFLYFDYMVMVSNS